MEEMQPPTETRLHDGLNRKQVRALNGVWEGLSRTARPRFSKYADNEVDRDGFDPLARYLWNIALGEALTPTLSAVELLLRNAIHNSMVDEKHDAWWFRKTDFLKDDQKRDYSMAYDYVDGKKRKKSTYTPPTADDLVAELSFGSWSGMLNAEYEEEVWSVAVKQRLSNLPSKFREDREEFRNAINTIREVRNRIAHHEPIYHLRHLVQTHDTARRIVGSMNRAYGSMLDAIDRFNDVHRATSSHFRALLLQQAGLPSAYTFGVIQADDDQTHYRMVDTSLSMCAAVFDCRGLAEWLTKMANTHPTRGAEIEFWRQWVRDREEEGSNDDYHEEDSRTSVAE